MDINIKRSNLIIKWVSNNQEYKQYLPFDNYINDWDCTNSAYVLFGASFENHNGDKIFYTLHEIEQLLKSNQIILI